MSASGKWADLRPRLISGLLLALVGVAAVRLGGVWFTGLATIAAGLMLWELATMEGAGLRAYGAFALGAAVMIAARFTGGGIEILLLVVAALGTAALARQSREVTLVYGLAVLLAADGLIDFRQDYGGTWLFWLIFVVIATDIGGYFAGRLIGGPKFWPRVSPKKTWAGTIAGWIGAALIGALFISFTTAGYDLIWISAAVAFASQMGDIAESAIKRRAGVKDSSQLIPGHGGLLDRFDGLLGAALMMLLVSFFVHVPVVRI
ncbi:phosphatidate cytidylyltransferase [Solirhodobacter olei]|uniref:phosphatidate cytidylyltransferase n=1 Tax=Solirhodobacter olei TaxID=2493082 RepID=UPI000FDBCF7F|nr:phosphatidate cytidylyltransferase [Solirhodobacter olei]